MKAISLSNTGSWGVCPLWDETDRHLFCDNETNTKKLYGADKAGYFKDGVQEFIIHGNEHAITISKVQRRS